MKKAVVMMMAGMMSVMALTGCGGNGQAKSLVDAQSKVISSIVTDHSTGETTKTMDTSDGTALADPSAVLAGDGDTTQIPNPWEEYSALADAAKAAGFEMSIPERPRMFTQTTYQVMKEETQTMLEVLYSTGDSGDQMALRKAIGVEAETDISGDYNVYNETSTVTVGAYTVTLKGNDQKVNLATWTSGDYAYSLDCTSGMTTEEMTALIGDMQ